MRRTPEVLDAGSTRARCRTRSGTTRSRTRTRFAAQFPADFISEGIDQTRGWFYTLHAIGMLLDTSRRRRFTARSHLQELRPSTASSSTRTRSMMTSISATSSIRGRRSGARCGTRCAGICSPADRRGCRNVSTPPDCSRRNRLLRDADPAATSSSRTTRGRRRLRRSDRAPEPAKRAEIDLWLYASLTRT